MAKKAALAIRDRIKELRRVRARDIIPNPSNWRKHSQAQSDAVMGLLSEIGYAGALLARETPDGLVLIDGHLRASLTPDAMVPVLILDVDEQEANLILATYDPLSAMAASDAAKLGELLADVRSSDDAVQAMLAELARNEGIMPPDFGPVGEDEQGRLDQKKKVTVTCPECGASFEPK